MFLAVRDAQIDEFVDDSRRAQVDFLTPGHELVDGAA